MSFLNEIGSYWDMRASGYSRQVQDEIRDEYDNWQHKFRELIPDASGKQALDIGCGPGLFTILLADLGCKTISFDYSDKMLEEAKRNVEASGFTSDFVKGDAHNLPFEEERFDVIVSRNLTWNLERPKEAYQEWFRVLRPGGCMINCDGNHYSYYYREEYLLERRQKEFFDGHNPEYMKGIDVTVIDNIAKELPLSREMRPAWDIEFLLNMGVSHVEADILRKKFTDERGKEHNLIKKFILKAVK